MKKRIRLSLDVSPAERAELDALAKREDCSLTAAVRRACRLLKTVRERGGKLVIIAPDGSAETLLLL